MSERPPMSEIAAVVLAAGQGVRFGAGPATSKMLAVLDGKPLVRWVAEAALASRCAEVIVVTGHAAEAVGFALDDLPLRLVGNPAFATGMASSLRAGIAAITRETAAAIVLLGDMPLITIEIIDALIESFEEAGRGAPGGPRLEAVVPTYDGTWGNPVLLDRSLFVAIMALEGDQGARKLLPGREIVTLPMSSPAITVDIDTPAVLASVAKPPSDQALGLNAGRASAAWSDNIASIASAEQGSEK